MMKCKLNNGRIVEDYCTPYIVAEVNSSHNGSIETAKKMIDAAKEAGCDCVKFQSWSSESIYSKNYYKANPIAKRFVDKFSMNEEDLLSVIAYCRYVGIDFSSTPYSEKEVDFLAEQEVPFIKIASMELNNPEFLKYIALKGLPVILSTGMGEYGEIQKAVKAIETAGNRQIILLHCVSLYPADPTTINLNNINGLRKLFPDYPIGFSDHTLGDAVAIAATALGAAVIEKHITLDRTKIGMDNQMAMEPIELKQLVEKCRMIQRALGSSERTVLPEEYEQRKNMRRSIVAARDLKCGQIIAFDDVCAKRPGTGIAPDRIKEIIGKQLRRDIEKDELIIDSDFTK